MSKKIGFWPVFSIITGSQIGSGVFMLPASLAPYGKFSILGWLISGLGAICLALVFSGLCQRFPRTGGPHVYVKEMFGQSAAFFTGWTYWVVSWISTTAIIIACVSYLSAFIGPRSSGMYLMLEIILFVAITGLNLQGVKTAGKAELILTVLKTIPLLLLPLIAIGYFNADNIVLDQTVQSLPLSSKLAHVALLTLWGFLGLETATTPAGSVENPTKTIPRAIVCGTIFTLIIYLINSIGIMGLLPSHVLASSRAPYVDATQYLFGGNWHLLIALIASIVCIGTLNAWTLVNGQIVLGLAEDNLIPPYFAKKNKFGAPTVGLVISFIGTIPLLFLTMENSIAQQITAIIDVSVITFIFIYMICIFTYLKILYQERARYYHWLYLIGALTFCCWIVSQTPLATITISTFFILSGCPAYFFWSRRRIKKSQTFSVYEGVSVDEEKLYNKTCQKI